MTSTRAAILDEAVARVIPEGRRLGLVIGIDAYGAESGIPPLRAAVADARAIHAAMVDPECGRFQDAHTVMLTDAQATDTNIRIALEQLRKNATAADEVWFFFAGHALIVDGEHRLLPINARREYLDATSVDFPALFRKIRCRRKIVFLDCCHAGATDTTTRHVHDVDELLRNYQASGTITYCSSDGDQKSVELPEQGHGAFTYWLEKGLRGAADADSSGIVTSDELWRYVCEHVERDAQRLTGRLQTPRLKLDASGSFALSVNIAALRARDAAAQRAEAEQRARDARLAVDIGSLRQLLGDDDYANLSTDELKAARALLTDQPAARAAQEIVRALEAYRGNQDANAAVLRIRGALVSARPGTGTRPRPDARPDIGASPPPRGPRAGAAKGTAERPKKESETASIHDDARRGKHAPVVEPPRRWLWPAVGAAAVIVVLLFNLPRLMSGGPDQVERVALDSTAVASPAVAAPAALPITGVVHTVRMRGDQAGYSFEPRDITIQPGDGVRFVMVSGGPHNVAFDPSTLPESVAAQLRLNMPDQLAELSGPVLMEPKEMYTISFAGVAAGTYEFHCTPHLAMGMSGTVTVRAQ